MHRSGIKESVLVGRERIGLAKQLNHQLAWRRSSRRRLEEHEAAREMSAVSSSVRNLGLQRQDVIP